MCPEEVSKNASLGVVFDQVKRVVDIQVDQIDKLDAKIGLLLGAASVSLAVILSAGFLPSGGKRLTSVFLVAGMFSIFISLVSGVAAQWIRPYNIPPCPQYLKDHYLDKPEIDTRLTLVNNWAKAYGENSSKINRKVLAIKISSVALAVGLAAVATTYIYNSVGRFP